MTTIDTAHAHTPTKTTSSSTDVLIARLGLPSKVRPLTGASMFTLAPEPLIGLGEVRLSEASATSAQRSHSTTQAAKAPDIARVTRRMCLPLRVESPRERALKLAHSRFGADRAMVRLGPDHRALSGGALDAVAKLARLVG
jgi:hypothetical protein